MNNEKVTKKLKKIKSYSTRKFSNFSIKIFSCLKTMVSNGNNKATEIISVAIRIKE